LLLLFILQLGGKTMNLSIREHIINNFKGDNYDTLRRAIDESVASQDEVTLPGLGVFLEIIWENADQELKNQLIDIIKHRVEKGLEEQKKEN
jgi:small acid-soluble spore protein I (minor)